MDDDPNVSNDEVRRKLLEEAKLFAGTDELSKPTQEELGAKGTKATTPRPYQTLKEKSAAADGPDPRTLPGAVEVGSDGKKVITTEEFERRGKEPIVWVRKKKSPSRFRQWKNKRAGVVAASTIGSSKIDTEMDDGSSNRGKRLAKASAFVIGLTLLAIVVVLALFSMFGFKIVSQHDIHWHADLSIRIYGIEEVIPPSIGLFPKFHPIHTHEPDNVIHMHNEGPVRERHLYIKHFFELWEEDFDKGHILSYKSPRDGNLRMFVNGEESFDYEKHIMHNSDVIEITLER